MLEIRIYIIAWEAVQINRASFLYPFSAFGEGGTMARKKTGQAPFIPNGRRGALYVRVSTKYQVDKDRLPLQRKKLKEYCNLIDIPNYEIFEDDGYSAKNTDRPMFQEMMNRIRAGEFTHLIVWKVDRISRNLLDFASMYQELKERKVTFISLN